MSRTEPPPIRRSDRQDFRLKGFGGLRVYGLGFRALGFKGLGFRSLGVQGLRGVGV